MQEPIKFSERKYIDWADIEGKTIKTVKEIGMMNSDVEITFTDESKVEISGGSSSGYPLLDIYKLKD